MQKTPVDDFVRLRLRELLHAHGWSHTKLCKRLTEISGEPWLLQRFGKLMNGHIKLKVEDLVWIARATGLSLVEIIREPGREFVADLTPSELKVLNEMRDQPELASILSGLISMLAPHHPKRRPSHAIIRDRMRRSD